MLLGGRRPAGQTHPWPPSRSGEGYFQANNCYSVKEGILRKVSLHLPAPAPSPNVWQCLILKVKVNSIEVLVLSVGNQIKVVGIAFLYKWRYPFPDEGLKVDKSSPCYDKNPKEMERKRKGNGVKHWGSRVLFPYWSPPLRGTSPLIFRNVKIK